MAKEIANSSLANEANEVEDMVSLRPDTTGVDNTIFVSTRGYAQHAPRIKIAVDPSDSLNAASKCALVAIHDFSVTGEGLSPYVYVQASDFIERNRDVLLAYWNCEIDTKEMISRLRPPGTFTT